MDLTKLPENVVLILASSLDSELLGKIFVNSSAVPQSVKDFGFSEGARVVQIEVSLHLALRIGSSLGFDVIEEPKLANQVLVMKIGVSSDTRVIPFVVLEGELGEVPVRDLASYPVGSQEASDSKGVPHPSLPEQWVRVLGGLVEGKRLVGDEAGYQRCEDHFLAHHLVVLVELLGVVPVVTELLLDPLNLPLS